MCDSLMSKVAVAPLFPGPACHLIHAVFPSIPGLHSIFPPVTCDDNAKLGGLVRLSWS